MSEPEPNLTTGAGMPSGRREPLGAGERRSGAGGILLALRDPVVVILLLAGFFDGISGNPIHAVLLFSVAVALAWDSVRRRREPSPPVDAAPYPAPRVAGPMAALALIATGVAYAVIVGGFARYSWPATAALLLPGAFVLALAWRGSRDDGPKPEKLEPGGVLAWAGVFVGVCLWELTNLLLQPSLTTDSWAHPTLSVLSDPVLAGHAGRSVALFVWLALGWFLVSR